MIVIATQTERRLLKDLQKQRQESPNHKCFFLAFSKTETPKDQLFETFLKMLEELPNSYMANVYICQDKDIFIMMQGFMQRHFIDFVQKLAHALNITDISSLIDTFELGVHWQILEQICTKKINTLDTAAQRLEEERRQQERQQSTIEALSKLNASLIGDLASRRQKRTEPVILVVDDDQISRTLVNNVLKTDYRMAFAENGEQALEEYVRAAPDVCFLDIGLPDISGHDLLEIFGQIDPDSYIIMFSGRKDKANMVKALNSGAQGFVGKPFSRDKLTYYIAKSPYIQQKDNLSGTPKQAAH